ncbi:large subunit ribosomal protein L32, partial [Tremellales sp. Uapishka_1]
MALALPSSRVFLASLAHLRPAWSLPCLPSSSTSPLPQNRWYTALIPSLSSLIELFPPILLAVPKSRVTHSRKSMRSANKGLKNKSNLEKMEGRGEKRDTIHAEQGGER